MHQHWKKAYCMGDFQCPCLQKNPRGISEIGLLSCTETMAVSQEANYCNKLRNWRLGESKIVSRLLGVRGSTVEWIEQGKITRVRGTTCFISQINQSDKVLHLWAALGTQSTCTVMHQTDKSFCLFLIINIFMSPPYIYVYAYLENACVYTYINIYINYVYRCC